ncbi:MAG: hypothetical protein P8J20_05995 [Novosphingobium sp.]|nr:hypothetical protein [Novosphingobium sp.]
MMRTGRPKGTLFVTKSVLGVALALGMVASATVVSSPALAAKKKKKEQGPKLKLSPDFQKAIVKAAKALDKKDLETAKTELAASEAFILTADDRFQYYSMMLNLGLATSDQPQQIKGLRGMLDTGLVPAERVGQYSSIAADAAIKDKDYDAAIAYARKAEGAGYQAHQVYPLLAQAQWGKAGKSNLSAEPARTHVSQGLANFKKGIDAMKAAGQAVPVQWYQVAVGKAESAGLPEVGEWAQMAFEADPSGSNLRTILRLFQRENPSMTNRENLDLLRLMYWSGGLVLAADFVEYAEMAGKSGIYGEVKEVIDDGRKTGVLGSAEGGEFYSTASEQYDSDKASLPSAVADARKASTGKIAAATGDAYLGYGDYAKAVEMFELALQKGGISADEVNTRIGIAQTKNGNDTAATAALSKVQGGVRGTLAKYWSDYIERSARAKVASAAAAPAPAQ